MRKSKKSKKNKKTLFRKFLVEIYHKCLFFAKQKKKTNARRETEKTKNKNSAQRSCNKGGRV